MKPTSAQETELYLELVNRAPVGLMILRQEGPEQPFTILAANPAVIEITRLKDVKAEELRDKDFGQVFPLICDKDFEQLLSEALRSGNPRHVSQSHQGEAQALENALLIQVFPLPNHCLGLALESVSERKRTGDAFRKTAQELIRSNSELEQLANAASHDLQEPLRTLMSLTQLLAMDYSDKLDARAKEYIDSVVASAKRLQSMVDGLFNYSRVGARKPFELVSCEEVYQSAVANLKVAIEERGAALTHETLPAVKGDRIQLIQLFQNLLANAIKFRGPRPLQIHVSARQKEQDWILGVRDNGIGIDPSKFDRIFVLFQRLHSPAEYPGTGIGLAVCKKIVAQHGGHMWVESVPGEGSVFYFTLPVVDPQH